jgi:outer membrane lipase/esterase
MPRTRHLAAAIVLGLAANAAHAQSFTNVISFGDSLSDAGNYPFGAGSFTTNPDDVWTQVLANQFGYDQLASNAGGTNYAYGGAPTDNTIPGVGVPVGCVPGSLPCVSVQGQINGYLTANEADPNALYTYWAGANDVFNYLGYAGAGVINSAQVQQFTGASAIEAVTQIGTLQAAGANYIVVLNLPDIGLTPAFRGTPNQASVSGLILIYNNTLNTALANLGDGIIPVNAYALVNEVLANPGAYGFTNVTSPACNIAVLPNNSSLFCTPATYVAPGANETYFFADGVHPTGAAHRILAQAVIAEINAPGQVSMLGEAALRAREDHLDSLRTQAFRARDAARGDSGVRGYADLRFSNSDFDAGAWSPQTDLRQYTLTAGADYRSSESWRWGGAVSVTKQQMDAGASDVDGMAVNGSLYAVLDFAHGYLGASLSGGNDSFDIDRHVQLGDMDRIEVGNTDASSVGFSVSGGLVFGSDTFQHGPFADVTWTSTDVDGFMEDATDSTSMIFDGYDRDSLIGRLGYQFQGTRGAVQPFGRVAYNVENEDDQVMVRAGLNSMNGHFVMPGYQPSDNWWTAEVGLGFNISDRTKMFVSYSGLFADDTRDYHALDVGFSMDLGSPAAVVEPEAAEPAPDCSALDDDGDGVNNCNDACPASAAGEALGPNGCPMPAAEPEVVPEAKPFRG